VIRRAIACCLHHDFLAMPGDLMHGTEIICAAGETIDVVNEKLADLLHKYGWTKREDERWQCAKHSQGEVLP
jgi:hypothetical protein